MLILPPSKKTSVDYWRWPSESEQNVDDFYSSGVPMYILKLITIATSQNIRTFQIQDGRREQRVHDRTDGRASGGGDEALRGGAQPGGYDGGRLHHHPPPRRVPGP